MNFKGESIFDVLANTRADQAKATGVFNGGDIMAASINTFDVTAGTGAINTSTASIMVTWEAKLNQPIRTSPDIVTHIAIMGNGEIFTKNMPFSPQEKREMIVLGSVSHANTVSIDFIAAAKFTLFTFNMNTQDLSDALGIFNIRGNIFAPFSNDMTLMKTAGSYFSIGANSANDMRDPNRLAVAMVDQPLLFRFTSAEIPSVTVSPNVDSSQWDNNGTLQPYTNPNYWGIFHIYLAGGLIGVAYPENEYSNYDDAFASVSSEQFSFPDDPSFVLRCYMLVKNNATDLSDPTQATFIEASRFRMK